MPKGREYGHGVPKEVINTLEFPEELDPEHLLEDADIASSFIRSFLSDLSSEISNIKGSVTKLWQKIKFLTSDNNV